MKKLAALIVLMVPLMSQASIAENFGFHCAQAGGDHSLFIGPAGPDASGYPSDMTTPRAVEISRNDKLESTSEATCVYSPTQVRCTGERVDVLVDLTTSRKHESVLGFLGGMIGGPGDGIDADAKAKMIVKTWLGFSEGTITTNMVCHLH